MHIRANSRIVYRKFSEWLLQMCNSPKCAANATDSAYHATHEANPAGYSAREAIGSRRIHDLAQYLAVCLLVALHS